MNGDGEFSIENVVAAMVSKGKKAGAIHKYFEGVPGSPPEAILQGMIEEAEGRLKPKKGPSPVDLAQVHLNQYVYWFPTTWENDRTVFYRLCGTQAQWEICTTQQVLLDAGLHTMARAFNNQFMYALSLNAQVVGPASMEHRKMVVLRNGVFDWGTFTLVPWAPELKLLGGSPVAYVTGPARIHPADNRVHQFLLTYGPDVYGRLIHWVFTRIIQPDPGGFLIFLIGVAGSGKTTMFRAVVRRLTGQSPASLSAVQIDEGGHELEKWHENHCNLADEIGGHEFKGVECLKRIATQSEFLVNPKYKTPFQVRCVTTPVFLGNRMPWLPDLDEALLDRLIFVRFGLRFRGRDAIEDLDAYLDAIPQDHWDSFFSDLVDLVKDNRQSTIPPVELMRQDYELCRDNLFVWLSGNRRTTPGTQVPLAEVVSIYQEDQSRQEQRCKRTGKNFEPDRRGSGKLFELCKKYLTALGDAVFADKHGKFFVYELTFDVCSDALGSEYNEIKTPSFKGFLTQENEKVANSCGFYPSLYAREIEKRENNEERLERKPHELATNHPGLFVVGNPGLNETF